MSDNQRSNNSSDIVKLLLSHGADVNITVPHDLHDEIESIKRLLEKGPDVHDESQIDDNKGLTPLDIAKANVLR